MHELKFWQFEWHVIGEKFTEQLTKNKRARFKVISRRLYNVREPVALPT